MTDFSAIGRRSRSKGQTKQRMIRRFLERIFNSPPPPGMAKLGHEENWTHLPVNVQVKAGKQTHPAANVYVNTRTVNQIQLAGDARPYMVVLVPDGWGQRGIIMITTDDFEALWMNRG